MITFFHILLLFISLWIAITDFRTRKIPNRLLLMLLAAWMCFVIIVPLIFMGVGAAEILNEIARDLPAALLGALLLFVASVLTKGTLGMGDVKLVFVLGLWLGEDLLLQSIFAGLLAALLFFAIRGMRQTKEHDKTLPLAPFIALGVCITVLRSGFWFSGT